MFDSGGSAVNEEPDIVGMRLVPATNLTPSKRPTAINPSSYKPSPGYAKVDVAWFDKKKGVRLVRTGELMIRWDAWFNEGNPELKTSTLSLTDAMALPIADIRYFATSAWDGEKLWTKAKVSPVKAEEAQQFLDSLLAQEGTVLPPAGWLGWYNLVDSESYPGIKP